MINYLKRKWRLWRNPPEQYPEPYVYYARDHRGWGDRIGIWDWEKGKLEGHLWRKPRIGDRIRFDMTSGQVLETTVVDVSYPGDPPDMFFATVKQVGFVAD